MGLTLYVIGGLALVFGVLSPAGPLLVLGGCMLIGLGYVVHLLGSIRADIRAAIRRR